MKGLVNVLRLEFIGASHDVGLAFLRVALGVHMLISHGWGKLMMFKQLADKFPDPLGIGSTPSLILAIIGEVVCSALLCAGLFTRLAALGSATTMAVAFFFVHKGQLSGANSGELAMLFLFGYVAIFLAGPDRYSADAKMGGKTG